MDWEITWLEWLAVHGSFPWLITMATAISWLGNGGIIWLVWAGYWAWVKRAKREAGQLFIVLCCSAFIVDGVLKILFCRPRPYQVSSLLTPRYLPQGSSFPSGHTATAFACATLISQVQPQARKLVWPLALLIGLSRLILGVHYPTDVWFGALTGIAVAFVMRLFFAEK